MLLLPFIWEIVDSDDLVFVAVDVDAVSGREVGWLKEFIVVGISVLASL